MLSEGLSIRGAAEDLGMPYHTLHSWVRDQRRARRKTIVKAPPKTMVDAQARVRELEAVVRIHTESRRMYGSPKITRELPKLGLAAHRNTVSRIMQECGIRAKYVRNMCESTVQQQRRVRTRMRRRQIFSSVTSPQTDQTRSGCATSLTFRRMKASSISRA